MEAVKNVDEQQRDTFELVLKEILDEQQKANNIYADNIAAINQLVTTVTNFNERLENLKIIPPPVDCSNVQPHYWQSLHVVCRQVARNLD
jgi:hypothetical protein